MLVQTGTSSIKSVFEGKGNDGAQPTEGKTTVREFKKTLREKKRMRSSSELEAAEYNKCQRGYGGTFDHASLHYYI